MRLEAVEYEDEAQARRAIGKEGRAVAAEFGNPDEIRVGAQS